VARTSAEILAQLDRMLPDHYRTLDPRVGFPAALADAEARGEALQALGTIDGAGGKWLTLHAAGQGIQRASGESNASLRTRIRNIDDALTLPAIKAAVDALIAPDECRIVEWYDGPYLGIEDDSGAWLGNESAILSMGPQSFTVIIPSQGAVFQTGGFLSDNLWLGLEYIGSESEPSVYDAIINEVNRLRAAGVFWRLVLET
jgi:hypothetical protein